MFTGLIEEIGTITAIQLSELEARLTVAAPKICADLAIGDSVSVNGACLTVIERDDGRFSALATAETLRRTALAGLSAGSRVNLERALKADGRLGGHFVLGHVDGVGRVGHLGREGAAVRLEVAVPSELMPFCVPKGSVAVDGVSLTIAGLLPDGFWISLIPHTLSATTLQYRRPRDAVNLETDIIGKYVARLLGLATGREGLPPPRAQDRGESLSLAMLRRYGFV